MKLKLEVIRIDGDNYEVSTSLWVLTQWERKYKAQASDLSAGVSIETLLYFAYEATKTTGRTYPATLDDFIKQVDDIKVLDGEPENPTQAEPTAAP